jgi:hypothetical protein
VQARIVAAAQGAGWLVGGWRLFRAAPLAWLAATLTYWFAMSALSLVPRAGGPAALVLVPAFTVGFMALARAAEQGQRLDLRLLFSGLRERPGGQLALGVVYLAGMAAAIAASALADGGDLARLLLGARQPVPQGGAGGALAGAALLAAAAYLPVMAAFWFAPPLVAWHSASVAKALFFSFFACLMNWRAFAVYGVLVALATLAVPLAVLKALLAAAGGEPRLAASLVFGFVLLALPILFASFYASYRDVFGYHRAQ